MQRYEAEVDVRSAVGGEGKGGVRRCGTDHFAT